MNVGIAGNLPVLVPLVGGLTSGGHSVVALRDIASATVARLPLVDTVAELCANREALFTNLADDRALTERSLGPGGLCASMVPGSIHVVLGVHDPRVIEQVATAHAQRGQHLVVVTVLPPTGEEGAAAVVGGDAAALVRLAPLFDGMRLRIFNGGESPSAAATLALTHIALLGCAIQAMSEAFGLARSYGVEAGLMHDVIVDGLFAAAAYRHYGAAMVRETYVPGVTVQAAERALNIVMGIAERNRIPLPSVDVCRDRLLSARAHGHGDRDWTVLDREQALSGGLR